MTNRRSLIQAGIVMSAFPLIGVTAARRETEVSPAPFALDGIVFDSRFAGATAVAQSAARYGVRLYEMSGDTTDIWYHHIRKLWQGPHGAFAGIASDDAMFVFETLAADYRMRVIYRGIHDSVEDGSTSHTLSGPGPMIDSAIVNAGDSWTERVGYALTHCAVDTTPKTMHVKTAAARGRQSFLVSWIIAPASWNMPSVGRGPRNGCGGMFGAYLNRYSHT